MDFEILEWRNAISNAGHADESPMVQFEQFLERASSCSNVSSSTKKRHLILLEDLPNILHYGTRERFHSLLTALLDTPPTSPPGKIILALR